MQWVALSPARKILCLEKYYFSLRSVQCSVLFYVCKMWSCCVCVVFTELRSILIHQCFCKVHVEVVQWIVVLLFASVCCTYCMLKSGGVIRTSETQSSCAAATPKFPSSLSPGGNNRRHLLWDFTPHSEKHCCFCWGWGEAIISCQDHLHWPTSRKKRKKTRHWKSTWKSNCGSKKCCHHEDGILI